MRQKPEGTGHINTVAGNHLAEVIWPPLFILGDGIKSLPPDTNPPSLDLPSVVRTDLYQGPELARHQCPAVSSANVCSTNKLNSRSLLHHCATLFYYINEMVTLSTGLKGMLLYVCVATIQPRFPPWWPLPTDPSSLLFKPTSKGLKPSNKKFLDCEFLEKEIPPLWSHFRPLLMKTGVQGVLRK